MRLKLITSRRQSGRAVWAIARAGGRCEALEAIERARESDRRAALAAFDQFVSGKDPRDLADWAAYRDGAQRWRFGNLRIGFFMEGTALVIVASVWQKETMKERRFNVEAILGRKQRFESDQRAGDIVWDEGEGNA